MFKKWEVGPPQREIEMTYLGEEIEILWSFSYENSLCHGLNVHIKTAIGVTICFGTK